MDMATLLQLYLLGLMSFTVEENEPNFDISDTLGDRMETISGALFSNVG